MPNKISSTMLVSIIDKHLHKESSLRAEESSLEIEEKFSSDARRKLDNLLKFLSSGPGGSSAYSSGSERLSGITVKGSSSKVGSLPPQDALNKQIPKILEGIIREVLKNILDPSNEGYDPFNPDDNPDNYKALKEKLDGVYKIVYVYFRDYIPKHLKERINKIKEENVGFTLDENEYIKDLENKREELISKYREEYGKGYLKELKNDAKYRSIGREFKDFWADRKEHTEGFDNLSYVQEKNVRVNDGLLKELIIEFFMYIKNNEELFKDSLSAAFTPRAKRDKYIRWSPLKTHSVSGTGESDDSAPEDASTTKRSVDQDILNYIYENGAVYYIPKSISADFIMKVTFPGYQNPEEEFEIRLDDAFADGASYIERNLGKRSRLSIVGEPEVTGKGENKKIRSIKIDLSTISEYIRDYRLGAISIKEFNANKLQNVIYNAINNFYDSEIRSLSNTDIFEKFKTYEDAAIEVNTKKVDSLEDAIRAADVVGTSKDRSDYEDRKEGDEEYKATLDRSVKDVAGDIVGEYNIEEDDKDTAKRLDRYQRLILDNFDQSSRGTTFLGILRTKESVKLLLDAIFEDNKGDFKDLYLNKLVDSAYTNPILRKQFSELLYRKREDITSPGDVTREDIEGYIYPKNKTERIDRLKYTDRIISSIRDIMERKDIKDYLKGFHSKRESWKNYLKNQISYLLDNDQFMEGLSAHFKENKKRYQNKKDRNADIKRFILQYAERNKLEPLYQDPVTGENLAHKIDIKNRINKKFIDIASGAKRAPKDISEDEDLYKYVEDRAEKDPSSLVYASQSSHTAKSSNRQGSASTLYDIGFIHSIYSRYKYLKGND